METLIKASDLGLAFWKTALFDALKSRENCLSTD